MSSRKMGNIKNLLSINDLNDKDLREIFSNADSFREIATREVKKIPTLRAKTVVNLFLEPSTRTRSSFEMAAKRLGADVINISERGSSLEKGESFKDTAKTLDALKADIIVLRHPHIGAAMKLSSYVEASVVNAGDGSHEHPTQALIDIFTANEFYAELAGYRSGEGQIVRNENPDSPGDPIWLDHLAGRNVVIVGDVKHSRVAHSNILAFKRIGANVTLCGPSSLLPCRPEEMGVDHTTDLDKAMKDADIIYVLRMQKERQNENLIPSIREYVRLYKVDEERLRKNEKDHLLIMHPGPVNRDIEISGEVLDSYLPDRHSADMAQSSKTVGHVSAGSNTTIKHKGSRKTNLILEQVENGIIIRMAVLYLLSGATNE